MFALIGIVVSQLYRLSGKSCKHRKRLVLIVWSEIDSNPGETLSVLAQETNPEILLNRSTVLHINYFAL